MARALPSALLQREAGVLPWLGASLLAHVALLGLLLLWRGMGGGPPMKLDTEPIKASLVRLGKPRDQKLLPRKEELPPPPPAEKPAPVPVAEPAAPPPPAKAAPSLEDTPRVAPAKATPESKPSPDARKKLLGAFDKLGRAPKPQELEGAEDGHALGDSARQEGDRYLALITAQVKRHYDVSQTISPEQRMALRAEVFIRISRTGEVMETRLSRPSGNDLFDSAVVAALKRASPLSPPPAATVNEFQRQGVTLVFKP
jgi:TonB family protein